MEQLQPNGAVRSSHLSCHGSGQMFLLIIGWRIFGRRDFGKICVGIGTHVEDCFLSLSWIFDFKMENRTFAIEGRRKSLILSGIFPLKTQEIWVYVITFLVYRILKYASLATIRSTDSPGWQFRSLRVRTRILIGKDNLVNN